MICIVISKLFKDPLLKLATFLDDETCAEARERGDDEKGPGPKWDSITSHFRNLKRFCSVQF